MKTTKKTGHKNNLTNNGLPDPTWTVAQLSKYFGVPPERLLLHPRAGMATEDDLIYVNTHGDRLCELVDGVLVEKAMGFGEGVLTAILLRFLALRRSKQPWHRGNPGHDDGAVSRLICAPDVSFFAWDRLPGGKVPEEPVPAVAPDLAVEVLSKSNSRKEMDRKVGEYFASGVRLVWLIDPKKKTVQVYTDPQTKRFPAPGRNTRRRRCTAGVLIESGRVLRSAETSTAC